MTTAQKLLVATDLSGPARHAVERAFLLAAQSGSELDVVHAMELDALDSLRDMLGGDVSAVKAAVGREAQERLETLTGDSAIHRGVTARACIVPGSPLQAISAKIDESSPHLVVLGARGESFLRHALLGSTAARLLRKAVRQPVLVVKQAPHEAYRSVLAAVDFSPVSPALIRKARDLAPQAELLLVHAFELPYEGRLAYAGVDEQVIRQCIIRETEQRRAQLHELAAAAGLEPREYSARIVHGDPSQQFVVLEQEYDCDLIVLGKHGRHVAEELLLGSLTKHVLAESQCDVLVMCDPRTAPLAAP